MIRIKDKVTGEVWTIREKEDPGIDGKKCETISINLKDKRRKYFNSTSEAMQWIAERLDERRQHIKDPKPASWWD